MADIISLCKLKSNVVHYFTLFSDQLKYVLANDKNQNKKQFTDL